MIIVYRSSTVSPDKVNTMVTNGCYSQIFYVANTSVSIIKGAKIVLIEVITSKAVYKT